MTALCFKKNSYPVCFFAARFPLAQSIPPLEACRPVVIQLVSPIINPYSPLAPGAHHLLMLLQLLLMMNHRHPPDLSPSAPRLPPAPKFPPPGPPLRTSTSRHPLILKIKHSLLNLRPSGPRNAPVVPQLPMIPSLMGKGPRTRLRHRSVQSRQRRR